jgi:hypothetical protein
MLSLPPSVRIFVATQPVDGDRRQLFLPVDDNYSCRSPPGSHLILTTALIVFSAV